MSRNQDPSRRSRRHVGSRIRVDRFVRPRRHRPHPSGIRSRRRRWRRPRGYEQRGQSGDSALFAINAGGSATINGPYGNAGFLEIGNTRNTDTALFVETFGNGTDFHAETHGAETASAAEGYDYSSIGGTGVFGYSLLGTAAEFIRGSGAGNSCSYDGASSGWNCTKTAATMENRAPLDFDAMLGRLNAMPIAYFATRDAEVPVREIGPSAEDFHRAFGLGRDAEHIAEGNASGVALAAAKGLYGSSRPTRPRLRRKRHALILCVIVVVCLYVTYGLGAADTVTSRR
jgi:hypothetical protein